ncbi:hypothetical protein ACTWPT_35590 [Nonomuraea sp. 3N208]|uniref:hypothetical protein n=1 Tax=Nonomuraea sp. 3N208 TaxID=3457421 RepID=UPI003FD11BDE
MLPELSPANRALVYGIVGGMPLYLSWWRSDQSVEHNLARLACHPDAKMIREGDLVLATEAGRGVHLAADNFLAFYLCARDEIPDAPPDTLCVTAADIFAFGLNG